MKKEKDAKQSGIINVIVGNIVLFVLLFVGSSKLVTASSNSLFMMIFIAAYITLNCYSYTALSKEEENDEEQEERVEVQLNRQEIDTFPISILPFVYKKEMQYEDVIDAILYRLKQRGIIKIEYGEISIVPFEEQILPNEELILANLDKIYSAITIRKLWQQKATQDAIQQGWVKGINIKENQSSLRAYSSLFVLLGTFILALLFQNKFVITTLISSLLFSAIGVFICKTMQGMKDMSTNDTLSIIKLGYIRYTEQGKRVHAILEGLESYLKNIPDGQRLQLLENWSNCIPISILFTIQEEYIKKQQIELRELSLNKKVRDYRVQQKNTSM